MLDEEGVGPDMEHFAEQVIELAAETRQEVEELESSDGLVDIDVVRTAKAMFYERVEELIRKMGGQG